MDRGKRNNGWNTSTMKRGQIWKNINRFFHRYVWRQKVVRYYSYTRSQQGYKDIQKIKSMNKNSTGAHGERNFRGNTLLISSEVKILWHWPPRILPPHLWLSWPFSRGFLFLWASQHHTQRRLPVWEGKERESVGEAFNKSFFLT